MDSTPNGNVSAPINVGTTDQIKNAGLGVNSLAVFGDAIHSGASRYLNFGSPAGSRGYGIRDNARTIEFKSSGGSWQGMLSTSACARTPEGLPWRSRFTPTMPPAIAAAAIRNPSSARSFIT